MLNVFREDWLLVVLYVLIVGPQLLLARGLLPLPALTLLRRLTAKMPRFVPLGGRDRTSLSHSAPPARATATRR